MLIAALATLGLFAALLGGSGVGPVAAVFPPWWEATRSLEAAAEGGSILGLSPLSFVVLVLPDEPHGRDRLWRAGVLLLLNPYGRAGCGHSTGAK